MRSFCVFTLIACNTVHNVAGAQAPSPSPAPTTTTSTTSPTIAPAKDQHYPSAGSTEPPALKPVPKLSEAEMEAFLKAAPITSQKVLTSGTTRSIKAVLSDGKLTHDAHIQCIDVFKPVWRGSEGTVEKNFHDSWKFNVAGYRLSKLLGLDNVPMSVERNVDGKSTLR